MTGYAAQLGWVGEPIVDAQEPQRQEEGFPVGKCSKLGEAKEGSREESSGCFEPQNPPSPEKDETRQAGS